GATPSLTTAVLPGALARFRSAYPGIDVKLHEAGSGDLVRELLEGLLDLALVILPARHPSLVTTPVLKEELVVAVGAGHPLASRSSVAIADLRDVPLVMFREGYDLRATTIAACLAAGFEPRFAVEGGEMDGVLRFAAAGLGVAIVPSMVVAHGGSLRAVRISRPALTRTVALAHRKDRKPSRAARELMDAVGALVRSPAWLEGMPSGVTAVSA
ncbi:MAG: LysR family transcriptional regulator substrate-binding protein, partial [Candidatus Limnocylindria bacterium]